MNKTAKQIKKDYFDRVYANSEVIKCSCGCGQTLKNKDKYGRDKLFINGHNNRKYDDPTQHKREWNHRNQTSRYKSKVIRGHLLKKKIIDINGGSCSDCELEYNGKNACVFQLHHIDPDKKEFVINTRTLINYSLEKIKLELIKCELLCANCHFIRHNKEY